MSVPIIEIVIESIVKDVIRAVQADVSLLDAVFPNLPAAELTDAKEFFRRRKITVVQGWPRVPADLPCVAIVLAEKREVVVPLGEVMGPSTVYADDGIVAREVGSIWEGSWNVATWSENGNATLYIDYLLEYVLTVRRPDLEVAGLSNVSYSAGDLRPKPELQPQVVYARERTIRGQYEVVVVPDERLLRRITATAIIGDPVIEEGNPAD